MKSISHYYMNFLAICQVVKRKMSNMHEKNLKSPPELTIISMKMEGFHCPAGLIHIMKAVAVSVFVHRALHGRLIRHA